MTKLCPTQRRAADSLKSAWELSRLFELRCTSGMGLTTMLRTLADETGGRLLRLEEFLSVTARHESLKLDEAVFDWLRCALREHAAVFVDDFQRAIAPTEHYYNPRRGGLESALTALAAVVQDSDRRLIVGTNDPAPAPISYRSHAVELPWFEPHDYEHVCREIVGPEVWGQTSIDFDRVHHFAPRLTGHQLRDTAIWIRHRNVRTTDDVVEFLRSKRLASNVELGEVAQVRLQDLQGIDEVVRALESGIVLPLEKEQLAAELGLKAKRGVLLAGPPGTGKTTIGRALAHRLKGKFFMIDGTMIPGTDSFYCQVASIFESARQNAPSVVFIDDGDVIFENRGEYGFYRYLLTLLDGIESESNSRVCVMITAMNVASLPPALVRSGRIELWLELKLPDADGRRKILEHHVRASPQVLQAFDVAEMAAATDGFTGADLTRLVNDARLMYAYDVDQGKAPRPVEEYYSAAAAEIAANRDRFLAASARQAAEPLPVLPVPGPPGANGSGCIARG